MNTSVPPLNFRTAFDLFLMWFHVIILLGNKLLWGSCGINANLQKVPVGLTICFYPWIPSEKSVNTLLFKLLKFRYLHLLLHDVPQPSPGTYRYSKDEFMSCMIPLWIHLHPPRKFGGSQKWWCQNVVTPILVVRAIKRGVFHLMLPSECSSETGLETSGRVN